MLLFNTAVNQKRKAKVTVFVVPFSLGFWWLYQLLIDVVFTTCWRILHLLVQDFHLYPHLTDKVASSPNTICTILKTKKQFRKSSFKGWSAQQRFNIISRKNKERNKQTNIFLCCFAFKVSVPAEHNSCSYRENYRYILWEESKNLDKIFKSFAEWPSKTKQWINSGSKCYWLELRDGSGKAGGESVALCAARPRAGSAIVTDVCLCSHHPTGWDHFSAQGWGAVIPLRDQRCTNTWTSHLEFWAGLGNDDCNVLNNNFCCTE